jgi:hypothetical protein
MAIDYSGLISESGRAALSGLKNMPPDQQRAKMNDMLANGLLPFSVAMAVDKQLRQPLKENAPSPRPGSVMEEKLNLLNQTQNSGIDQLSAPDMEQAQFAGGGIVAFAGDDGSLVGESDPFAGLAGMKPTDKRYSVMQFFKNIYNQNKEQPDEDEIGREIDAQQKAGGYGKYSKAAIDYENVLKGREKGIDEAGDERKARRAGWLAMAQAGAEGKGLLAGATAGFSKYGDISDAREEKRNTQLRELQKEQYTLQLGREQAVAAGDQERVKRYDAALDRNSKALEVVSGGVMSMYKMESEESRAAADRAVQGKKEAINERYGNAIYALEKQLDDPSKTLDEKESIKAQIKIIEERWNRANRAVASAAVYRTDVSAETAANKNRTEIRKTPAFEQLEAASISALNAAQDPTISAFSRNELVKKYVAAEAAKKKMLDEAESGGVETPSAEAGLAGAGAEVPRTPAEVPSAPNGSRL